MVGKPEVMAQIAPSGDSFRFARHSGVIALKEGDQVMVKMLVVENDKIELSRKAMLREAREKQKPAETAGAEQASAADAGK